MIRPVAVVAVEARHPQVHQHDVGPRRSAAATAASPSATAPTTSMSPRVRQQRDDPGADDRMVVGHEHADHGTTASEAGTGIRTVRRAPPAVLSARRSEPPTSASRSRIPATPNPLSDAFCSPTPSSVTASSTRPSRSVTRSAHPLRAGVLAHVREGLLRAAQQHDLERPGHVGLHGGLDDDARSRG